MSGFQISWCQDVCFKFKEEGVGNAHQTCLPLGGMISTILLVSIFG